MKKRKSGNRGAFVGRQGSQSYEAEKLKQIISETFQVLRAFYDRIVIPDDFMADHKDRDSMIVYLKALSCKGNETGAAYAAKVSMKKLREWQQIEEFAEMEDFANQAYTDLLKEIATAQIIAGDKALLQSFIRARDPSFAERQEITGPKGGPIPFQISFEGLPRPKRLD